MIDAVYIPPEVDELTDEENFVEEANEVNENENIDIAGTFEIHVTEEDLYDDSDDETLAVKKRKLMSSKAAERKPKWTAGEILHCNLPESKEHEQIEHLKAKLEGQSPLDIFFNFFDEAVQDMIVEYSVKYARDNNRQGFSMTKAELLNFIGIIVLSGYHTLPQAHLYWSTEEDKGVNIVKDCMSRNKFKNIKQNLHLSDNSKLDKNDRFSKLRPFFDIVNEKFMQFDVFAFNLSIDEQMVPYFGRHSCKMYIKGKPVRFGFKLWCICSSEGYLYRFIPYGGAAEQKSEFGLGTKVVLDLLSIVENRRNHNIFFDNFFSSYKLFSILKEEGFFATGTIRENRTSNCPLQPVKSMMKKNRGFYDSQYDESTEIALVRWNDNSIVTTISTHYNTEPVKSAKRYNRKQKTTEHIPQPSIIFHYNKHMGGVDLHDNGVANYRTRITGKKWWWPLFVNTIDSIVVNAWKIYNTVNENKMSQLDFKSYIALRLLKTESRKARPAPSSVPNEVRLDSSAHLILKQETRRRCRVCHSQTIYLCGRCNVYLHASCFDQYHS